MLRRRLRCRFTQNEIRGTRNNYRLAILEARRKCPLLDRRENFRLPCRIRRFFYTKMGWNTLLVDIKRKRYGCRRISRSARRRIFLVTQHRSRYARGVLKKDALGSPAVEQPEIRSEEHTSELQPLRH